MSGGRYVAALALGSFASAGLAVGALATPAWHMIDSAEHLSIGIFQTCRITDGIDESRHCDTITFPSAFCGHDKMAYQMRHVFTAIMGIIAVLLSLICGLLGLAGHLRQRKHHPKTMMALSVLSTFFMTACISLFSHTYDGWLYCGYGYCTYAQHYLGVAHTCRASYGYSYVLAASSLGFSVVASMACGLYVRFLRCGYLDEHGNVLAKVIASKETFLSKLRQEQQHAAIRGQQGSVLRHRNNRALPPDNSMSPDRTPAYATPSHVNFSAATPGGPMTPTPTRRQSPHPSNRRVAAEEVRAASLSTPNARQFAASPPNVPQDQGDESGLPEKIGVDESWILDESSGLYWSEREQLYLKATGRQLFFDPKSQMWYDPVTEQWTDQQPDMVD